jgi:hypothetical protein
MTYQLRLNYGIHFPYDEYLEIAKIAHIYSTDSGDIRIGFDDYLAPNRAYIDNSVICGTEGETPQSNLNFNYIDLKREELCMKRELHELNAFYDVLIETIDPDVLFLGWSAYMRKYPADQSD